MSRARYGVDAPPALFGLVSGAVLLIPGTILTAVNAGWWALWPAAVFVYLAGSAALYLHTTKRGKFAVWAEILDDLGLRGDERVLDLGCGRGAVLIAVAKRLPQGHVTGADLWRSVDQSGNAPEVTTANAAAEGVAGRVSLDTADMTALPYPDDSFDLVVASMAIHNIHPARGRRTALDEALRVLRPGGRLVIADISAAKSYQAHLTERGLAPAIRSLGWRMWWGGPWLPTLLVTAVKT
ncbi:class I SAM-dependent methyltransferase [Actinoplanes sp. NPDC026619]|uniref:class I SAM-dependent methyltransferase n=1 Tax=Actinoplanes sp. NPDC026619 TaxID=3155798 RepID=UPI0033FD7C55